MTSNSDKMGLRYKPMAFTEQGVAMLSSVLKSERAIEVNIAIMRAFVTLRQMLASNAELARKLERMENKYDERFKIVFEAIQQLTPLEEMKTCTIPMCYEVRRIVDYIPVQQMI